MVSGELSENEGDGIAPSPSLTYAEQFHEAFPYYLSIGMSCDEYWNGDPWLAKAYRKAEELKLEKMNQRLWLQGMYVYDAICCASPILHAFAKKGTKAVPYPKEPYPLTGRQKKKVADNAEKKTFEKGKAMMMAFMERNNKRFENKGESGRGGGSNVNDNRLPTDRDK